MAAFALGPRFPCTGRGGHGGYGQADGRRLPPHPNAETVREQRGGVVGTGGGGGGGGGGAIIKSREPKSPFFVVFFSSFVFIFYF